MVIRESSKPRTPVKPRTRLLRRLLVSLLLLLVGAAAHAPRAARALEPLEYGQQGLVVDLGVGLWAWPLPMDYDGDGDLDLVVSCPDVPYNGLWFFENVDGQVPMPVFAPGVRIDRGPTNIQVSYVDGQPRVLLPGQEAVDFCRQQLSELRELGLPARFHQTAGRIRANQWKYVDLDGDGALDLVVGIGDWTDYGWDDAFDARGRWTRGPLHGWVYFVRNEATTAAPRFAEPVLLEAGGKPIDVYGMPSPNLADFDGDGDLDLICGEFLDGLTYFENIGTPTEPRFAAGRRLLDLAGSEIRLDLQMIVPVAVDWDGDGHVDLVVGQEDGRVALVRHTGQVVDGLPRFEPPRFFQQQADHVKFGALVTPVGFDWDGDGDEDLVCGNTAGYVGFIENLGGTPPRWAPPRYLEVDGEPIRIMAGPNGSIQGPCEAKWGYTTLSVADWDGDGLPDLVVNSIWGRVVWYRNIGTRTEPRLAAAQPVRVDWPSAPPKPAWNWWDPADDELVTQWRTTPVAIDFTRNGLVDLVMLDHEGYLCLFERSRRGDELVLTPPQRIFVDEEGRPLQLNSGTAGKSGRRKFTLVDWDGDGHLDLLRDSVNVTFYRGRPRPDGTYELREIGPLDERKLAGHDTSPTTIDLLGDGVRDLVVGAEDGFLYYLPNPRRAASSSAD